MLTATFPQSKYRFRLYDNAAKKTWQQIKQETGCYALINLAYFNMATFAHDDAIMIAGEWKKEPQWSYYGILIDKEGRLTVGPNSDAVYDYANAEPIYYILGTKVEGSQAFSKNGATMLGMLPDDSVVLLLASKDDGITSDKGIQTLLDMGCKNILRYDGSWSSQGSLGPDMDVDPSQERKVRSYLLVFEKEAEPTAMDTIKQDIMTNSACYKANRTITPKGIMVHSTGTPGLMAQALRDRWNTGSATAAVHAMIDDTVTIQALPWNHRGWHAGTGTSGSSANNTHISFEICEPQETRLIPVNWVAQKRNNGANAIPWAITRIQQELVARGYDPNGVDGSFGGGCEAAVKQFQQDNGLSVDGSVGKATLAALANREGSYLAYNPADTQDYFNAIWDRAVYLCSMLCKGYNLDPLTGVICHSEGYSKGVASNHADVMHWFPLHGKTMDDFRAAVKAAMNETTTATPVEPDDTDDVTDTTHWAQEYYDRLIERGVHLSDTRFSDNITRGEAFALADKILIALGK